MARTGEITHDCRLFRTEPGNSARCITA